MFISILFGFLGFCRKGEVRDVEILERRVVG